MRTGEGPVQVALRDVSTDQFLEALHYNRCRCHGTVVMQITDYGLFWQWDYNRGWWDSGLREAG